MNILLMIKNLFYVCCRRLIHFLGPTVCLCVISTLHLILYLAMISFQLFPNLIHSKSMSGSLLTFLGSPLGVVLFFDSIGDTVYISLSKPFLENVWTLVPQDVKYRCKLFVDTFGSRLGVAVAAMLAHIPISRIIIQFVPMIATVLNEVGSQFQDYNLWGVMLCFPWFCIAFALSVYMLREMKLKNNNDSNNNTEPNHNKKAD